MTLAPLADKAVALRERMRELGSVLVGFSGGVDSSLVTAVALDVLGKDRVLAVHVRGDFSAPGEADEARLLASELGVGYAEIVAHQLDDPALVDNSPDRCYRCKQALFSELLDLARARGLAHVADGANADDSLGYRPGSRATAELGIASPLAEAGFTKADVRALARELGLTTAEKPSAPCLATRFPYGEKLSAEKLARVDAAESALRALGFAQVRVRSHGDVARVEVAPAELERAWALRDAIATAVRGAGFPYVALDLEGYRSGSLDEVLGT